MLLNHFLKVLWKDDPLCQNYKYKGLAKNDEQDRHIPWVACGVGISWTDRWGGRHFHCSSPSSSPPQFYPHVYHIQLHWSMASHWVQEPGETRGPEEQWSFEGSTTQSHLPSKCLGDLNRFFPTRTGSGLDEALLNDSAHSAQHINMSKNYGINHVKVRDYAVFKDLTYRRLIWILRRKENIKEEDAIMIRSSWGTNDGCSE